jgi:hypothetical protein
MNTERRLPPVERQLCWFKRLGVLAIAVLVAGGHPGCTRQHAPEDPAVARVLSIRWQRLVDEELQTCPRCQDTELELGEAVARLEEALTSSNVRVDWIAERPLEEWLEASVGESPCCESCGDADCRTLRVGSEVYEAISADLIVRAGLRAAATLMTNAQEQ